MPTRGLGRGLDSLLAPAKLAESKAQPITLPVAQIRPNRFQPRRRFGEENLQELANSIRQQGVIQPIVVAKSENGTYEIIAGERRWRACKLAGFKEIPAIVRQATERELLQFSLVENIQREELNPIEEAMAFTRLMEEFDLTQEELSKILGKSRVVVANTIRLLNLPDNIKNAVADGTISAGHARSLVSLNDEKKQKELAEKILKEKITVREVEKIVSNWKETLGKELGKRTKRKDPEIRQLEETLQRILGTKVEITAKGTEKKIRGKIMLSYYSLDDLERLVQILKAKQ